MKTGIFESRLEHNPGEQMFGSYGATVPYDMTQV